MIKKNYMKPSTEVFKTEIKEQMLASTVQTTGLGDNPEDKLTQDDTPGNSWDEGMSRRRTVWDEDEEE